MDDIEKVKKAIEKGNVGFTDRAADAIANMDFENPDYTITELETTFWGKWERNKGGVNFDYVMKSAGCGRVEFHMDNDGKVHCYSQAMSKEFVKGLLAKWVDEMDWSENE